MSSLAKDAIFSNRLLLLSAVCLLVVLGCWALPVPARASTLSNQVAVQVQRAWTPLHGLRRIDSLHVGQTYSIFQDRQGFVWLGTENGVIRYDGDQAVRFQHEESNPSSLTAKLARGIAQTEDGTIWIGTYGGGLDRFDSRTDTFSAYRHKAGESGSLASDRIWSLSADPDGSLWVGTFDAGLDHFNPSTGRARHFQHDDTDQASLASNRVNCIFRDSQNRLWVCTEKGLDLWLGADKGFEHFHDGNSQGAAQSPNNVPVWSVSEGPDGRLWVLSADHLKILSADLSRVSTVRFESASHEESAAISPVLLRQVVVDHSGRAWIASMNGLYEVEASKHTARRFTHASWNSYSLLNNKVWCILQDKTGLLWFGTYSGVDTLDPRAMYFTYITATPDEKGLKDAAGTGVAVKDKNFAWVASQHAIQRLNLRTNKIDIRLSHSDRDPGSLAPGFIEAIYLDSKKRVWVGTGNGLLDRISPDGSHIEHLHPWQSGQNANNMEVAALTGDSSDVLWIGTFGKGLFAVSQADGRQLPSWWNNLLGGALQNIQILSLMTDKQNRIWITTIKHVFVLDPTAHKVTPINIPALRQGAEPQEITFSFHLGDRFIISTAHGLYAVDQGQGGEILPAHTLAVAPRVTDAGVLGATLDEGGRIWFATYNGLYRYDLKSQHYSHFSTAQGLPFSQVNYIRSLGDGRILAQGQRGLVLFRPADLKDEISAPQARVTSIRGYRGTKVSSMHSRNGTLLIPSDQVTTTLHFAVFDYRDKSALEYRYRMLGFDNNWIDSGQSNSATYTNLPPGHYTFQMMGANSDGIWTQKPVALAITVLPPWWRTWWAYLLYTLVLIGLVTSYVLSQRRKLAQERAISSQLREADALKSEFVEKLKQEVASATRDLRDALEAMRIKNVELDEANRRALDASRIKSEFLSNMSHEIRTPMSGILGFLELLERTRLKPEQSGYLDAIRHSADSLLGIIDDILDLSRIEAGKLALDATAFNPRDVIEGVLELLAPIAYDKGLELVCVHELPGDVVLRGDPLRLRQILVNLAGNAVKYTNEGTVSLNASIERETEAGVVLRVAVTDTGIGIAPQQQENLFQAFNRGDMDVTRRYRGTGLGLSICKMLIDAMHGEIRLHSTQGVGSTFEISLELPREHRAPASAEARPLKGRTAVVYDRNPVARRALINALENLGLDATEAAQPAEIRAAVAGEDTGRASIDLLVVGLGTDVERDMEDIAGALAARPAKLPTLALVSTMRHALLREIGDALGVDARPKTLRLERLNEIICALLKVDLAGESPKTPRVSARTTPELGTLLKGMHILVTDDNRINRTLLVKMLSQAGADVEESADGRDAIDKSKTESFDAILMDIHMPGLSGIEVTQSIRRRDQTVAIIGVSANALPETKKTAMAAGIDDYLVKPVREAALIETILRCVQARKDRPSGPTGRLSD